MFIQLLHPAVATTAGEQTHRKERWDAVKLADLNTKEASVLQRFPLSINQDKGVSDSELFL